MHTNIHSSITHNSQKTETQMSVNWWIGELNVMYPCSWILFGNRRERNFHPHCIIYDTWKHSKWKWSHVWLFCMIPLKCPKQASLWRLKVDEWMQRVRGRWGKPANKYRVSFWGDESVSKLIVVMAAQLWIY